MAVTRQQMLAGLRDCLVPALRLRGFQGSLPHFRRIGTSRIDLLTVQFDKWGGGFIIEIAKCDLSGVTLHWGEHVGPKKVTAHDVNVRHLLGSLNLAPGQDGHWFRYDEGESVSAVARSTLSYLDEAEEWWAMP